MRNERKTFCGASSIEGEPEDFLETWSVKYSRVSSITQRSASSCSLLYRYRFLQQRCLLKAHGGDEGREIGFEVLDAGFKNFELVDLRRRARGDNGRRFWKAPLRKVFGRLGGIFVGLQLRLWPFMFQISLALFQRLLVRDYCA